MSASLPSKAKGTSQNLQGRREPVQSNGAMDPCRAMETHPNEQMSNGDSSKAEGNSGLWVSLARGGDFHCGGRASPSKCGSDHQPRGAGSQDIWVPAPEPSLICDKNLSGNVALLILQMWIGRLINEILLCPS